MHKRQARKRRSEAGQSLVELSLVMPALAFLLLGAVDFARISSVQQRLEHAAHLATLRLRVDPNLDVTSYVQAESGLATASAGASYSVNYSADSTDGVDQVVVTATYAYPLLLPGLQDLRLGSIGDGKLHVGVQAAGIAATDAPVVVTSTNTITVTPSTTTPATPVGLTLTCTLLRPDGMPAGIGTHPSCSPASPFVYSVPSDESGVFTATVVQADGIASPPITVTIP